MKPTRYTIRLVNDKPNGIREMRLEVVSNAGRQHAQRAALRFASKLNVDAAYRLHDSEPPLPPDPIPTA